MVNESENMQSIQHVQSQTTQFQQTFQSTDMAQNPLANDDRNTLCAELVFRSTEQPWKNSEKKYIF